jgi:large subunit ribosomal protein L2
VDKIDVLAKVGIIEYDLNRSADVALLYYKDGEKRHSAPVGLKVGATVISNLRMYGLKRYALG